MAGNLGTGEKEVLKAVLSALVVNNRTGEVGFIHGFGRFVGTKVILKKKQIEALDAARLKIGLAEMKPYRDK